MNGAKWISNFPHPKRWTFEIDEEFWHEYPANRQIIQYEIIASGDPDSQSWHYGYDHYEDAQAHAERAWGVPLDSWVEVKNFEEYQLLLEALVTFRIPANFSGIAEDLGYYGMEAGFANLTQDHVTSVLVRYYLTRELSARQVGDWARAVEGREDIRFDGDVTLNIVRGLANPKGKLTPKIARRMLDRLATLMKL